MKSAVTRRRTGWHHSVSGSCQSVRRCTGVLAVVVAATLVGVCLLFGPRNPATEEPLQPAFVDGLLRLDFVAMDDVDVLHDAAVFDGNCRVESLSNHRRDVLSGCVDQCRSMATCHAATFVPLRESMVLAAPSNPLPIHTFAEQNARVGACTLMLCNASSIVLEDMAVRLRTTVRRSWRRHRRHAVAPTAFIKRNSPLRHAFSGPLSAAPSMSVQGRHGGGMDSEQRPQRQHGAGEAMAVHFLMLSAPAYVHRRLVPALRTWLQDQQVSIFLDVEGDGKEAHQRVEDDTEEPSVEATRTIVHRAAAHGNVRCSLYALSAATGLPRAVDNGGATSWIRRRSLNGAWKPLSILLFLDRVLQDSGIGDLILDDRQWLMMVDDDTFVVLPNVLWHIGQSTAQAASRGGGGIALGEAGRYSLVMSQRNYVPESSPFRNYSTALRHSMHRLDYLQGGGGIVGTSRFFITLRHCLATLGIFNDSDGSDDASTAGPDNSTASPFDGFTMTRMPPVGPAAALLSDGAQLHRRFARGFGDAWPAGDMRLAWAVAQCNTFFEATTIRPPAGAGTPEREAASSPHLQLLGNHAFSHRSLELSLGTDRRHWVSAFPATFHRCRTPADFDRLQFVCRGALAADGRQRPVTRRWTANRRLEVDISSLVSWRTVEGNAAMWWSTRLLDARDTGASGRTARREAVHDLFFNDGGFA